MINKESIILFKKWVLEGRIFLDEYSHAFMLEENISQGESEFYAVAPEFTGLLTPLKAEDKDRYSFCNGQFIMNKAKPSLFEPKPAKLCKIEKCSYFSHEHHKSNLLSAINFASFHYRGGGFEGGLSCLSDSLSIAKTLNQIGNISEECTLIAAVLKNVVDLTYVKIESIEMLFGKHVRKIIDVLSDIDNDAGNNAVALLEKLDKASDDAKHVHLAILSGELKYVATLDEKKKHVRLSRSDQQARVCESTSSSLFHSYMVERSKFD
jgi:hypothetical protein